MPMTAPDKYRIVSGPMRSKRDTHGNCGLFLIPRLNNAPLRVIASDGVLGTDEDPGAGGWEHVSVSLPDRCPTWAEMCKVKDLFWTPDTCVMQLHPPEADYVNCHPHTLHLWRPIHHEIPRPPQRLV